MNIQVGQRFLWSIDSTNDSFIAEIESLSDIGTNRVNIKVLQIISGSAFQIGNRFANEILSRYYTYLPGQNKPND